MSDSTAKLGMLHGSMRTVTPGGKCGVRVRSAELHELLEHRRQVERLGTKASTDEQRAAVEALLSESGDRIEVVRRRLDAREKSIERKNERKAEAEARRLAEARAMCQRAAQRLAESLGWEPRVEKHVTSVVVAPPEASSRPCLPGPASEQTERDAASDASVRPH